MVSIYLPDAAVHSFESRDDRSNRFAQDSAAIQTDVMEGFDLGRLRAHHQILVCDLIENVVADSRYFLDAAGDLSGPRPYPLRFQRLEL
jgi:hypothetical protein